MEAWNSLGDANELMVSFRDGFKEVETDTDWGPWVGFFPPERVQGELF
jgi:hypothetical protein